MKNSVKRLVVSILFGCLLITSCVGADISETESFDSDSQTHKYSAADGTDCSSVESFIADDDTYEGEIDW